MGKLLKRTGILFLLVCFAWFGILLVDKDIMSSHYERGNSNRLWDSVVEDLSRGINQITDVALAKEYLQERLPKLENFIQEALSELNLREQGQKIRQFFLDFLKRIENFLIYSETYPVFGTHSMI